MDTYWKCMHKCNMAERKVGETHEQWQQWLERQKMADKCCRESETAENIVIFLQNKIQSDNHLRMTDSHRLVMKNRLTAGI